MIYVECKPDEVLIKNLVKMKISRKRVIHAGNKPEVCKSLKRNKNCIGIIDEDPWSFQPSYLSELKVKFDNLNKYGIKVLYDDPRNNYLILLCPRLEEWILNCVKEIKINIKSFGLPDTGERLHECINLNLENFKKLINHLENHGSIRITEFKKLLTKMVRDIIP